MNKELKTKLKEIGYLGKTDLETLLDALPKTASTQTGNYMLTMEIVPASHKCKISYGEMAVIQEAGESLADTAARLWLKLKSENLI
jgi:hypothetical protein